MFKKILLSGMFALAFSGATTFAQESNDLKTINLQEVEVTASRMNLPLKNIPQKVEIIDKQKILSVPNENLVEVLKRLVNLDIIQYPGAMATVGMRGLPATAHNRSYTVILIDGKPAGTNNLATIPTDFIERIEVVKGPYSVLYGSDAMSGVINIVTKMPDKAEANVSLSLGSFGQLNYNQYAAVPLSKKVSFSLGLSRRVQSEDYKIGSKNLLPISETEKLILDKKSYGDVMTNTQYEINQFFGKIQYKPNNQWSVNLLTQAVLSHNIQTPGNYWHSYGLSKKDIDRINLSADIRRQSLNNAFVFSPYFSVQNDDNYNNNQAEAFINSKEKIKQYGLRMSDEQTWGDFKLLGGVDVDAHDLISNRFSGQTTPIAPYRPDYSRLTASAFVQGAYTWDKLFVNAGLRYNYTLFTLQANEFLKNPKKTANYSNLNPSIGVKYYVTPKINVHASAGTAFYVPDAYKTAGFYKVGKVTYVGNKDLNPETITSFDAGVNFSHSDLLNIDATFFQSYYDNRIVNKRINADTTTYTNANNGRMSGLELMISSNIARLFDAPFKLELYGSFTHLLKNNFDVEQSDKTNIQRDMLYVRRNSGNFGISFNSNKGFNARVNARYIGKRLENDWMVWDKLRPEIKENDYYAKGGYKAADQILQHSSHLVFDTSAYYTFCKRVRVGISVSNLFDENYTEKDGYNMPGRSIMGSFSYTFL